MCTSKGTVAKNLIYHFSPKFTVMFLTAIPNSPHPLVVIKFPRKIADKILKCKDVVSKMSNNTWFPVADIIPTLASVTTQIGLVDAATLKAKTRVLGAAAARKQLLSALVIMVYELSDFVQRICDANPGSEVTIAQSAGMDIRMKAGRNPYVFTVQATTVDGQVECCGGLKKGVRANHEFQVGTDPTDTTKWYVTPIPVTGKAKRLVDKLPVNVKLYFRHRLIIKEIPQ